MVFFKILGRVIPKVANSTVTHAVSESVAKDSAKAAREAIAAARKAANPFDYGRKVFALPEGQVTTRSGRTYIRTIGSHGERIYTDAAGNKTTFNGLIYKRQGYNESAIYRTSPEGGCYSLRFSTSTSRFDRGKQEVTRWVRERVGGPAQTTKIEINPNGRVVETNFDYYNESLNPFLRGIRTRYGCPTPWEHQNVYGWLTCRGVTEKPPIWTSLSQYTNR